MSTIRGEFPDVEYQGWDASEEMLDENTKNYGNENTKFFYKDIIENDYPKVDMALCRDVMFHLKPEYTLRIFDNIKKAGIKYLLATSFNEIAVGMPSGSADVVICSSGNPERRDLFTSSPSFSP